MVFQKDTLKDKVAIITGGGTGIGKGIAMEFAKVGAHIVVASRKRENLENATVEIRGLGARALAIPCDVRQPDQVDAMVQRTVEEFGKIDILVNNAAGIFRVPSEQLSINGWRAVVGIVLDGSFFCSRAVGKEMIRARKGGCIINILGTNAWLGYPGRVHSACAKAGVLAMTRTLGVEWGSYGIRVNAIVPGAIPTEGAIAALWSEPGALDRVLHSIPLRKFGTPEDIAWAAIYLASEAGRYVNGEALVVDAGRWLAGR